MKKPHVDIHPIPIYIHSNRSSKSASMPANHVHDSYELYYLVDGERFYFIEDRIYRIEAGDLVLINRFVLHKTLKISEVHERLLINVTHDFMEPIVMRGGDQLLVPFRRSPVIKLDAGKRSLVEQVMRDMLEEYRVQGCGWEVLLRMKLGELLVAALRASEAGEQGNTPPPQDPVFERLTPIIQYINEHYASTLTLPDLAGRFHISPYYLSRLYKKATGFTISDYINRVRVKEAQKLLRHSSVSITDVAGLVGFDSLTHFGRMFRSLTGLPPSQYRKQHERAEKN